MYALLSFVLRGRIRYELLKRLTRPKTPTALAQELKTHQSTTSRALAALEAKKLVKCLTPDEKLFRLYQITKKGTKVLEEIASVIQ